jgi:hypothetical protein
MNGGLGVSSYVLGSARHLVGWVIWGITFTSAHHNTSYSFNPSPRQPNSLGSHMTFGFSILDEASKPADITPVTRKYVVPGEWIARGGTIVCEIEEVLFCFCFCCLAI